MASLTIALNAGVRPASPSLVRDAQRPFDIRAVTAGQEADDRPGGDRARTPRPVGKPEAAQDSESARGDSRSALGTDGLTDSERDQIARLRARDAEVRRHEEAHARVGGQYAGQPSYTYQTGPDGKRYAIGGEVPIDVSPVPGDPEATIDKMGVVKRAALAPAEPSGQDRRVAAMADRQSLAAQAELNAQRLEEQAARFEDLSAEGDETGTTDTAGNADPRASYLLQGLKALSRGPDSEPGGKLVKAA